MRTEGTIFPVSDLKDHLENIKMEGVRFFDQHYVGELVRDAETIKWNITPDKYPVTFIQNFWKFRWGQLRYMNYQKKVLMEYR